MKISTQDVIWWNEAIEVIEATEAVEAVEVIEAAEVPEGRKITQYVKCKVSFSPKKHRKAKNVEKEKLKTALHLLHSISFLQILFLNFYISPCRGLTTSKK